MTTDLMPHIDSLAKDLKDYLINKIVVAKIDSNWLEHPASIRRQVNKGYLEASIIIINKILWHDLASYERPAPLVRLCTGFASIHSLLIPGVSNQELSVLLTDWVINNRVRLIFLKNLNASKVAHVKTK